MVPCPATMSHPDVQETFVGIEGIGQSDSPRSSESARLCIKCETRTYMLNATARLGWLAGPCCVFISSLHVQISEQ